MKSRLPKTKASTTAAAVTTATAKAPRKRISLPRIQSLTIPVAPTIEAMTTIATLFSAEEIHQLVEKKAYELFERRGYAHGHDLDDWLEAEKIIREDFSLI